jgi:hypothetical protein
MASGDTLILRFSLETNTTLPQEMTLAGFKARHSWVDSRLRVTGYPPLQSETAWTESRMLLGAAVHQVVEEFQLRPPEIVRILDPNLQHRTMKEPDQSLG